MKSADGLDKAALVLLALGAEKGALVWSEFSQEEARLLSETMAGLGPVSPKIATAALEVFREEVSRPAPLEGNLEEVKNIVSKALPERSEEILEPIETARISTWRKLEAIPDDKLKGLLADQHPQIGAVVLSRLSATHAARVLPQVAPQVAQAYLRLVLANAEVNAQTLEVIESFLEKFFFENDENVRSHDPLEKISPVFDALDKKSLATLMANLREVDPAAADRLRAATFTFDDLVRLDSAAAQTLIQHLDREALAYALKGQPQSLRAFVMRNMSRRSAKFLEDDMRELGPVPLKKAEKAQDGVVRKAKDLARKGEIQLPKPPLQDAYAKSLGEEKEEMVE